MSKLYNIILVLFIIIGIILFIYCQNSINILEKFTNLEPGLYPTSVDKALLIDYYEEKKNPQLSNMTYGQMSKFYPVFPADSFTNNNIKKWGAPDNGTCSYPDLCDAIYEPKQVNCDVANITAWKYDNLSNKRVNLY